MVSGLLYLRHSQARRLDPIYDGIKDLIYVCAVLRGYKKYLLLLKIKLLLDLLDRARHICCLQLYFVYDGDDVEAGVEGLIKIRDSLRLNALGGINY